MLDVLCKECNREIGISKPVMALKIAGKVENTL